MAYASKDKYWVNFGKKKLQLRVIESGFVEKDCQKCKALTFLEKSAELNQENINYKNPYSVACRKLGGKVRIGKLYSGHSQSFCFHPKDNSFISTNILKFKTK